MNAVDLLTKRLQELGYTARRYEPDGNKVIINEGLANQGLAEVNPDVSEFSINEFASWLDTRIKGVSHAAHT